MLAPPWHPRPDSIKDMQRNWIGRSEGAQFGFEVVEGCEARGQRIEVYTTRPDTIFGATYVVIAPEHQLARQLATDGQRAAVVAYVEAASRKSELERTELSKDKTGVWTGSFVKNPATGEAIPVWVAGAWARRAVSSRLGDLTPRICGRLRPRRLWLRRHHGRSRTRRAGLRVCNGVQAGHQASGGGQWQCCHQAPVCWRRNAHEQLQSRDRPRPERCGAFARRAIGETCTHADELLSTCPAGVATEEAAARVCAWLEQGGLGSRKVNYKLRDWLFARQARQPPCGDAFFPAVCAWLFRCCVAFSLVCPCHPQRYWGEPFPIVFPEGSDTPVPLTDGARGAWRCGRCRAKLTLHAVCSRSSA